MKFLFLFLVTVVCVSCANPTAPGYSKKSRKYRSATPEETSIMVSLWDQKAWLINGAGEAILETDVATGVSGKDTPEGVFPVVERLEEKRSNRYGRIVSKETGKVVIDKSWEHEGPLPEGTEYEGIEMPYWMRLTWDGVGMHVGDFPKRTKCSFGCIRVYKAAQPLIFRKTQIGTKVEVVSGSLAEHYGW